MSPRMYAGQVNAPEFPAGLEWMNTDKPLTMTDLRGKVVVLGLLDILLNQLHECISAVAETGRKVRG